MRTAGSAEDARGIPALLTVVVLAWGMNIPAVKALTGVMDVIWVGVLRLAGAATVLTVCLLLRDRRLPSLPAHDWFRLGAIALLAIYLNQLFFVNGMRLASGTNASLVMALNPLLAVLAGALVFGERIGLRRGLGVAIGFAGVAVAVLLSPAAKVGVPGAGELLLFCGLFAFIGGGLMIQRMARHLDAMVVGWAIYVVGSLMLFTHAMAAGGWQRAAAAVQVRWVWACVLYSGVFGTALSNVGWYYAIGRVGQSRASPYLYWIAVFGVASSMIALHESLGWWHLLGLALVVTGVRMGAIRAGMR